VSVIALHNNTHCGALICSYGLGMRLHRT